MLAVVIFLIFQLNLYSNIVVLDHIERFAFLSLTCWTVFACFKLHFVKAVSYLVILICYEPATRTFIPEIGRAFTIYSITICFLILFIRCKEFSWPALIFACVGFSFFMHAIVDYLLIEGLSFKIFRIDIYRT